MLNFFLSHADYRWLNHVAPMLLAPLFGVPCGLYRLHHCVMHHAVSHITRQEIAAKHESMYTLHAVLAARCIATMFSNLQHTLALHFSLCRYRKTTGTPRISAQQSRTSVTTSSNFFCKPPLLITLHVLHDHRFQLASCSRTACTSGDRSRPVALHP